MKIVAFEKNYPFRDKMPVVHYPIASQKAGKNESNGEHLNYHLDDSSNTNHLIYIHFPFCESLCYFCPYSKILKSEGLIRAYLNALKKEIILYSQKPYVRKMNFVSVYIGGGTPSLLDANDLLDLLNILYVNYNLDSKVQITVEGSPLSFSYKKFKELKHGGVNRISMGVQTFDENLRKTLGLSQKSYQVKRTIEDSIKAGFKDVSIDLMYNLPNQTYDSFAEDIKQLLALGINQCTLYALSLVPTTRLFKQIEEHKIPDIMSEKGEYNYANISNYILKDAGLDQVTNTDWLYSSSKNVYADAGIMPSNNGFSNLLAFGASSFGEINNVAYLNTSDIDKYINALEQAEFPIAKYTVVEEEEKPYKYITMGLRKLNLSNDKFFNLFGVNLTDKWGELLKQLKEKNLIEISDKGIHLTSLGCFYVYNISKEFFSPKYSNNPQLGYCGKKI